MNKTVGDGDTSKSYYAEENESGISVYTTRRYTTCVCSCMTRSAVYGWLVLNDRRN